MHVSAERIPRTEMSLIPSDSILKAGEEPILCGEKLHSEFFKWPALDMIARCSCHLSSTGSRDYRLL